MRALALVLLLPAVVLAAEEKAEVTELQDEILITATRLAREAGETGATVSAVLESEIEERQFRRSAEAIAQVPGAWVQLGGPPGAPAALFLRGAKSNQTVVMIDGIKANDPTIGGQFNFYDLGVDNTARIEVMRGSASALYGSEAIGGVVNIVPPRPSAAPAFGVRLEAGTYGYRFAGIRGRGKTGPVDFSADLSTLHYDNELPNNEFDLDTFAGRLGFDLGDGLYAWGSLRWYASTAQDPWDYPFSEQIEEDENIERKNRTTIGGIGIEHAAADWFFWRFLGSGFDTDSTFENGPDEEGDPAEQISDSSAQVFTALWTGEFDFPTLTDWLGLSGLVGLQYRDELSKSEQTFGGFPTEPLEETVESRAAFAIAELTAWERLRLSLGIRREKNSFFGWKTSPSASVLYHHREWDTRLRANYGEGFRAPQPIEFSDPYVGNPDLGPEQSQSFDVGVEQGLFDGKLLLTATWFQLRTKDLIAWDPDTGILENYPKTRVRGFEFALVTRPVNGLQIRGWLTLQDPKNLSAAEGESDRLPYLPQEFGGAEVQYGRQGWQVGAVVNASGEYPAPVRITPDGEERKHTGRRLLVTLRGEYRVSPNLTLTGRITNLLDDDWYDDPNRPNGLGRAFILGFLLTF